MARTALLGSKVLGRHQSQRIERKGEHPLPRNQQRPLSQCLEPIERFVKKIQLHWIAASNHMSDLGLVGRTKVPIGTLPRPRETRRRELYKSSQLAVSGRRNPGLNPPTAVFTNEIEKPFQASAAPTFTHPNQED